MPDDVKVSTRGLTDGGGTPLRKFKGILDSYYPDSGGFGGKTRAILNYKEVEVVESAEPYPYPVAQIPINLSNRKGSGWGVFSESLNALIADDEDIESCVGKKMTLEMKVGYIFGQNQAGEDMTGNVWRVTELQGAEAKMSGGKSAADVAKGLLDGKNQPDFNKEAYQNAIIRADGDFLVKLGSGAFVTEVLASKEFTKDKDGIFHKAK